MSTEDEDICGLCGEPGADKMALWTGGGKYWPGEHASETEMVHQACEQEETIRAHAELSESKREAFLAAIRAG